MKYKWNTLKKVICHGNKVILASNVNGKWMRISEELYKIIEEMIQNQIDSSELEFERSEDENFFNKILKELYGAGIVIDFMKDSNVQNKMASIELTHRCNLHCIHCCIDATKCMDEEMDIQYDEMIDIFNKLIFWDPKSIMLSGGEPMLRKDFFELAEYLRKNYKGHIMLSTNGLFITEKNVHKLCSLVNQIDISLDGYNEETCSQIRGKGVFEKVVKAVKLLKSNGFMNISLSMATADKNAHWEKKFDELNKQLGTRPMFRLFTPIGRGKESKDFFTEKTEDEVYIPEDFLDDNREHPDIICSCSAGKREIFIDYKGGIYPCPSYVDPIHLLGNILVCSDINQITKIYDNMQMVMAGLKKNGISDQRCIICPVNAFCWTCPGSVESISTNRALESQCRYMYPVLMKRIWEE